MKINRLLLSLLWAILATGMVITPVLAFPPLPSSLYGEVKVNGQNVPDGTLVRALIAGKVYATTSTQTYEGSSVYRMDVPGDEADTTAIEGGKEGDTIQFEVDGVIANETGVWHSGTHVNQSLTVNAFSPEKSPLPATATAGTQTVILDAATPTQAPSASNTGTAAGIISGSTLAILVVVLAIVAGAGWLLWKRRS
jgi:hypothetical protein